MARRASHDPLGFDPTPGEYAAAASDAMFGLLSREYRMSRFRAGNHCEDSVLTGYRFS